MKIDHKYVKKSLKVIENWVQNCHIEVKIDQKSRKNVDKCMKIDIKYEQKSLKKKH